MPRLWAPRHRHGDAPLLLLSEAPPGDEVLSQEEASPYLTEAGPTEQRDFAELGHKLTDKKLREWTTNLKNPAAMSVADTAQAVLNDEFSGTGLEKDFGKFLQFFRDNSIAEDGWRAKQLENVAAAAAQRAEERREFRDKLLGSLER